MPRAPKKCAKHECEVRVRNRKFCEEHTVAWQGAGRVYTKQEEDLAAQVRREEPTCRDCGAPTQAAGHIVPHAYGGKATRSNMKGQCNACNNAQIHTDRVKYLGR